MTALTASNTSSAQRHTSTPHAHPCATQPPSLSEDKRAPSQESPLEFIVQRAAVDPTTRWRRTYQLGDKQELLVTVKQPKGPEGPTHISIISDTASSVVLHWGVCKPGERLV